MGRVGWYTTEDAAKKHVPDSIPVEHGGNGLPVELRCELAEWGCSDVAEDDLNRVLLEEFDEFCE